MTDRATPKAPVEFPEPIGWLRRLSEIVNALVDGKHNGHGEFTCATGTTITLVTDYRVGADSRIFLEPTTANALADRPNVWVSDKDKQAFEVTHTSTATSDRTYDYLVVG